MWFKVKTNEVDSLCPQFATGNNNDGLVRIIFGYVVKLTRRVLAKVYA